jgi:transposase-like protein
VASTNETLERPRRRTFTAEYKLRILQEADAASAAGDIGLLLRRESLYSSHLAAWRREREAGAHAGLSKRRGPAPRRLTAEKKRVAQLERENERLRHRLKKAEVIIEVQKKLHELLGIPITSPPESEENSP